MGDIEFSKSKSCGVLIAILIITWSNRIKGSLDRGVYALNNRAGGFYGKQDALLGPRKDFKIALAIFAAFYNKHFGLLHGNYLSIIRWKVKGISLINSPQNHVAPTLGAGFILAVRWDRDGKPNKNGRFC